MSSHTENSARPPVPLQVSLQADTDQGFAWAREKRASMTGADGDFIRSMADRMALQLKAEFPDVNSGRIVMAVADSVNALADALQDMGVKPTVDVLVCITSLAAEQLDREH